MAEEAVRLVVDPDMPKRRYKKLITSAQEKSKAVEQILGGGWISPFRSYRAMHNAWKRLCKCQKLCVVTHGEYLGLEWKVASFLKYIATQPHIIDGLHLKKKPSLTLIVRGDWFPCGSRPWCQLVVGFVELEELTRSFGYNRTVNIALCGESQEVVLGNLFAENVRYLQWTHGHQTIKIQRRWVDCRLKMGGDSRWLHHLLGYRSHWMCGSVYTYAVWTRTEGWKDTVVERTVQLDRQMYRKYCRAVRTGDRVGKRIENVGGCTHRPLLCMHNRWETVVLCILHILSVVGKYLSIWTRERSHLLRPARLTKLAILLRRGITGVVLAGKGAPDGEES